METEPNPTENHPPENTVLYRLAIAENALRRIAGVEWPVNILGENPQTIAREAIQK